MPFSCLSRPRISRGFTLIELLIAMATVLAIMLVLAGALNVIERTWRSGATDPFSEAQDAFETVVSLLSHATLETYQDYADANGAFRTGPSFLPDHLARRSDLAFVCGPASGPGGLLASSQRITTGCAVCFTAPEGISQSYGNAGLERLLNAIAFFVDFGDDDSAPPYVINHRWRWRLRGVQQPAESLQVYAVPTSAAWLQPLVPKSAAVPILAENVVTLIVLPERNANDSGAPLSPAFTYDSRDTGNALTLHQLPPRVRVALVAIDDASAERLAAQDGPNPPPLIPAGLFQQAGQLDADLAQLDTTLLAQKIGHRIYQREIQLPSSAWSGP